MIVFEYGYDTPKDFTGVCKILGDNSIRYYKNDNLHREDGPAVECANGDKQWYINDEHHREDGPAVEYINGRKSWWFKDIIYGYDNDFTIETWKEKVEELKREDKLSIFI